jgi:hypothetical protein
MSLQSMEIDMINIKLTKISANTNNLRTSQVLGKCFELPKTGEVFTMYSEGIEYGTRMISTSLVQEVHEKGFKTQNSEYALEVLPEDETTPA